MIDEKRLIKLIESIRTNPFLKKYQEILERTPKIQVRLVNNSLELSAIEFSYYDQIVFYSKNILFLPEHGSGSKILEYNNWEELYKIFGA